MAIPLEKRPFKYVLKTLTNLSACNSVFPGVMGSLKVELNLENFHGKFDCLLSYHTSNEILHLGADINVNFLQSWFFKAMFIYILQCL